MVTIVITPRQGVAGPPSNKRDDFVATIEGYPAHNANGDTPREAIGNLIMTHKDMFDITVDMSGVTQAK